MTTTSNELYDPTDRIAEMKKALGPEKAPYVELYIGIERALDHVKMNDPDNLIPTADAIQLLHLCIFENNESHPAHDWMYDLIDSYRPDDEND